MGGRFGPGRGSSANWHPATGPADNRSELHPATGPADNRQRIAPCHGRPADNRQRIGACHDRLVDPIRIGAGIRAIRRRRGWRQSDLAVRAGVSKSTVGRIERGEIGPVPITTLQAVAAPLDARIDLSLRWHGEALDRLLDERHASVVDSLARLFREGAWRLIVEATFAIEGERGSIDLLAWHPPTGCLAVNEVKASIGDAQATIFGVDRKARLAPLIARTHGWAVAGVARILVVADDRTARRRIADHAAMFEAAFPVRGREVRRWIASPSLPAIAGLVFLTPARSASGGGPRPNRLRVRAADSSR